MTISNILMTECVRSFFFYSCHCSNDSINSLIVFIIFIRFCLFGVIYFFLFFLGNRWMTHILFWNVCLYSHQIVKPTNRIVYLVTKIKNKTKLRIANCISEFFFVQKNGIGHHGYDCRHLIQFYTYECLYVWVTL